MTDTLVIQELERQLLVARLERERDAMGITERQFALLLGLDPAGYWRSMRGARPWGRVALERIKQRFPELVPDGVLEGARLNGPGSTVYRKNGSSPS